MTSVHPNFQHVDDAYLLAQPKDRRKAIKARRKANDAGFAELNTMSFAPEAEVAEAARRLLPWLGTAGADRLAAKVVAGIPVSGRLTYRVADDQIFCFLDTTRVPKAA